MWPRRLLSKTEASMPSRLQMSSRFDRRGAGIRAARKARIQASVLRKGASYLLFTVGWCLKPFTAAFGEKAGREQGVVPKGEA